MDRAASGAATKRGSIRRSRRRGLVPTRGSSRSSTPSAMEAESTSMVTISGVVMTTSPRNCTTGLTRRRRSPRRAARHGEGTGSGAAGGSAGRVADEGDAVRARCSDEGGTGSAGLPGTVPSTVGPSADGATEVGPATTGRSAAGPAAGPAAGTRVSPAPGRGASVLAAAAPSAGRAAPVPAPTGVRGSQPTSERSMTLPPMAATNERSWVMDTIVVPRATASRRMPTSSSQVARS